MSDLRLRGARVVACAAAVSLLCVSASSAQADDRAKVRTLRAQQLAAQGECDRALEALEGTTAADRSPALDVTAAQCEIRLGRYAAAAARLEETEAAAPDTPDAALFLGVARYHTGDLDGAGEALERARGRTADDAQLELYSGMVLLQRAQTREAALALERARRTNARSVEPVASYYALLAWQAEGDRERAQAALARVQEMDPDGEWSARASEALAADAPPEEDPTSPWWIRGEVGLEYDSNVALISEDGPVQPFASEQDDLRAVWSLDGGLGIFRTDRWEGSLIAGYSGSAHFDAFFGSDGGINASDFDTHVLYGGARIDRRIGDTALFRWQVDYTSWWVNGIPKDDFLQRYRSIKYLTNQWSETLGSSQLHFGFFYDEFKFQDPENPLTVNTRESDERNRDGVGIMVGLQHRVPLPLDRSAFTAGYNYTLKSAEGTEYDFHAHELFSAFSVGLPCEIDFDWRGSILWQDFQTRSSFPDALNDAELASRSPRDDRIYQIYAGLTRGITRHLSASTRYYYTKSNSNSPVFRYDRHVVGAYLTLHLP